jgi:hypothetical protein
MGYTFGRLGRSPLPVGLRVFGIDVGCGVAPQLPRPVWDRRQQQTEDYSNWHNPQGFGYTNQDIPGATGGYADNDTIPNGHD